MPTSRWERREVAPVSRAFAPEPPPVPSADDSPEPDADPAQAPSAAPASGSASTQLDRWRLAVEAVKAVAVRQGKSLAFGRVVAVRPGEVVLAFPKDAAFHRATVTGSGRGRIEQVLSQQYGRPTRLVDDPSDAACAAAPASLAELDATDRADRERGIEAKVRSHPAVRAALRILGGELEHVQVLERERPAGEPEAPDEGA